jgi:phosphatidylserine/phosphatidylglycerophosphate/cardiolipin synthase-like enzyme
MYRFVKKVFLIAVWWAVSLHGTSSVIHAEFSENGVLVSDKPSFLKIIDTAKETLMLGTYKLQEKSLPDAEILKALGEAVKRGVSVTLMTEDKLTPEEISQPQHGVGKGDALKAYQEKGVKIISSVYPESHLKVMVADKKIALVGTTNCDKNFIDEKGRVTRDFMVEIKDTQIIQKLLEILESDAAGKRTDIPYDKDDVLCVAPDNYLDHVKAVFEAADPKEKIGLITGQQDYSDERVLEWTKKAIERGVGYQGIMSLYPFGTKNGDKKSQAYKQSIERLGKNAKVYLLNNLHYHAKVMIANPENPQKAVCLVGSLNFYEPATRGRQIGLILRGPQDYDKIQTIYKVMKGDIEGEKTEPLEGKQYVE